jgi:hypothetical protein
MSVGRSLDLPSWNSITAVFPGVSAGRGRAAVDGLLGAERLAAAPSRRNPSVFLTGEDCTGTFSETPNRPPGPSRPRPAVAGSRTGGAATLPGNALPALPAPWTAGPRGAPWSPSGPPRRRIGPRGGCGLWFSSSERDWRSGSALRSHRRGHWFDPSIAHRVFCLVRRPVDDLHRRAVCVCGEQMGSRVC